MPDRMPAPTEAGERPDPDADGAPDAPATAEAPAEAAPSEEAASEGAAVETEAATSGGEAAGDGPTVEVAAPAAEAPAESSAEQTAVMMPAPGVPPTPAQNAWFKAVGTDDDTKALAHVPAEEQPADAPTVAAELPEQPQAAVEPPPRTPVTGSIPISQAIASVDPVTERLPVSSPDDPTVRTPVPPPPPVPAAPAAGEERPRRRGRKLALVGGGLLVALGVLYGADLALSSGSVPRGTAVAGVPIGGLSLADARQSLRSQFEPRTGKPVALVLGGASSTIDPGAVGLQADYDTTVGRVSEQPLNPITRLTSFFTTTEAGVVTTADDQKLTSAIDELAPIVDKPAQDGTIRFEGLTPVPVEPAAGQKLDVAAAAGAVKEHWLEASPVALPLVTLEPKATRADVDKAITAIAKPSVSGPVTVTGEGGTSATFTPEQIAASLSFHPAAQGGLTGEVDPEALKAAVGPALAPSETPGQDATVDLASGKPVVVPSKDGRGVDYPATATAMGPVLVTPAPAGAPRTLAATYSEQPAKITTDTLTSLGITGLVSEFSTGGFAADSGLNIKRAAEQINGIIVQPGETFSLNQATNPRDAAHGYVEAGIIEDGHPARGVGGGVSQVATTTYNAAYFAGMDLVSHREHSFYISRYPPAREATVFDDVIDLKFRNSLPTAVMIQTVWTPAKLTVRFLGTKVYDVTSTPGPRTNPTDPKTVTLPAGDGCHASKGAPGFTATDTRTLTNIATGEVRTDPTHTVKYNPSPIVECGGD